MTETGRYLYAIARGLDPQVMVHVPALGGGHLDVVEHLGLAAVVSTVDLGEYGEEGLRRNLEDLAWLETVVRRHDDVVHEAATRAATAPMRLATICFDDDAVRARLREWHVDLTHVLDRVDGCAEWSVKVLAPPAVAPEATDTPVSGADYLRRRKAAVEQRADADTAAAVAAEAIDDELAALARAGRRLPPQDPRLSGLEGTMVLNAAYLVPHEQEAEFEARIRAVAEANPDVVVDGRGPWPPYSFAMLDQQ